MGPAHNMNIKISPVSTLQDNYVWVIIDSENKSAIIVDPGEAAPVHQFLTQHQLKLKAILITHHHWDHTNGIAELLQHYQVPVFGAKKMETPEITNTVEDGANIKLPPFAFDVIAIPGHTLNHIAYYAKGMLFCGDTLFAAGCGRMFEGTPQQLFHSLQKLAALPDDTNVYCAHEYTLNNLRFAKAVEPHNQKIMEKIEHIKKIREKQSPSLPSTILDEKETNPFLRCDSAEIKANVEAHIGKKLNSPLEIFTELRKWKDIFK